MRWALWKLNWEIIHIEKNLGTKLTIFFHTCPCFISVTVLYCTRIAWQKLWPVFLCNPSVENQRPETCGRTRLGLWGRIIKRNWDKEFSSMLLTVTTTNGFYSPYPMSKSGLKLVCNVNIEYGNLKSGNSQDYAQKPQRNCTFMNSALLEVKYGGRQEGPWISL